MTGFNLSGANDGARTHDNRYHKPGLYQLSYIRHHFDYLLLQTIGNKVKTNYLIFLSCAKKINNLFSFSA